MASSKERQRKLAQAKAMRQMARRTEKARRNRRIKAAVTAVVVVAMVGLVGAWAGGAFEPEPKPAAQCAWTPTDDTNTSLQDVGKPPTRGIPTSGTKTMTIAMGQGTVEATIDLAKVPCTAASLTYLAGKKFYDNTKCHRLVTGDLSALQCGDPSTKDSTDLSTAGKGGPAYTFADENLPAAPAASTPASTSAAPSAEPSAAAAVTYARGTIAMTNKDQLPDQNGSQFYIFFKDSKVTQKMTVVGTVTKGLDVIDGIAKAGIADKDGQPQTDGQPKAEVKITSLTMSGTTPAPTAPQTPAPTSTQPSGAASAPGSAASSSGSARP